MTHRRRALIAMLAAGILAGAGQAGPARAGLAEAQAAYNAGDFAAAFKGLKPAAEAGDAEAQALIAGMYARGQGIETDLREAARWYALAADQGHLYATTMLGWFHMRGMGVDQDAVKGYRLLSRAAARGQPRAVEMKQAVVDKALSGLDDLAAAEAENQSIDRATAYFRIGQSFALGHGVPRLPKVAAEALHRAAGLGHGAAQYEYAVRLDTGDGTGEDPEAAFEWFRKAADQGHADALAMVGRAYLTGRGTAVNRGQAMVAITRAKAAGSKIADTLLENLDK
ncbi:MAG: tetratricopeptide repeat protein [Rhodospirillales bacterium]